MADRIAALRSMVERRPDDARMRFGLALELLKDGRTREGADELRRYLEMADDEGNAWGRLGAALRELGDEEAAKDAYRKGIAAAYRHGHPTMAAEFEATLEEWD